ncbi:MAG: glycosyltransferase [Nitrospira sp.]|nr:glycosyltransferase [Nitrospira sp.]
MRQLRLCFVGPAQNITTRRWIQWFARQGHEVTLLTVEPAKLCDVQGFRQIDLTTRALPRKVARLVSAVRLAAHIRSVAPDVVHVHYLRGLAWGILLSRYHPYVVTPWGSDVLAEQGAFRDWSGHILTRQVLIGADLVTAHSQYLEDRVRGLFAAVTPIARIGWGVDLTSFRPGIDTTKLRRCWSIEADQRVILSPRLAQPFYRHEVILEAFKEVHHSLPNVVLVIPEQFPDHSYVRRLRILVDDYDLKSCVRFVGSISYADMPLWLNLAQIVVMAPRSDGMPNTLLEAMACGAFPVLGRLPQYEEIIESGRNGLLVDSCARAISEALQEALGNAALRRSAARRNLELMEASGSQDREMMRMEQWYDQLRGNAA